MNSTAAHSPGRTRPRPAVPFFYLRHGTTDHNFRRLITGQLDIPLNAWGRTQAAQAARHLTGCGIERIVSSPLRRALETAQIVASVLELAVETLPSLSERNWGALSGRSLRELPRRGFLPEGVEPLEQFSARTLDAVLPLLHGPRFLLVGHSGHCRVLRRALLAGHDGEGAVPNGVPLHYVPQDGGNWQENLPDGVETSSAPHWPPRRMVAGPL